MSYHLFPRVGGGGGVKCTHTCAFMSYGCDSITSSYQPLS